MRKSDHLNGWAAGTLVAVIALVMGGETAKQSSNSAAAVARTPGVEANVTDTAAPSLAPMESDKEALPDEGAVSVGIKAIVKMAKAGVPEPVMQSYAQYCATDITPTAKEIIYLHTHGISSAVMMALIQHSKEWPAHGEAQSPLAQGTGLTSAVPPGLYGRAAFNPFTAPAPTINPAFGLSYPVYWVRAAGSPVQTYYPSAPYASRGYASGYPAAGYYVTSLPNQSLGAADMYRTTSGIRVVKNFEAAKSRQDLTSAQASESEKRANDLAKQRERDIKALNDAQQKLAAWDATGLTPGQVQQAVDTLQQSEQERRVHISEKAALLRENAKLQLRLASYEQPDRDPVMREGLKGRVVAVDRTWNFVVLNIGAEQGALEHGVLLVNRDGNFVAKLRLTRVQPNYSIANIVPEFKQQDPREGDEVIK